MIQYPIWSLVTLSGQVWWCWEARPSRVLQMVSYWLAIGQLSSLKTKSWPLIGYLSSLNQYCVLRPIGFRSLIGQLYGLITESWPLIGQSWSPVSPRPWRKIMEAVCLILGFRMTGLNDILLRCSHFVTINTAFKSLARRGWGRGCREQILCHGNYIDAWDPTPWLLWSCWWSPVALPCISCDSRT